MDGVGERCTHPEGVTVLAGSELSCPVCRERLDLEDVERWVRDAEGIRDELYSMAGDDELARLAGEECQREVYRRRRVLYELKRAPRGQVSRPEMILVTHDAAGDAYECRIFYKEPRPVNGPDRVRVEADLDRILALRLHSDPNIRLVSGKIEEFHALRGGVAGEGMPAPPRRVYYSSEL